MSPFASPFSPSVRRSDCLSVTSRSTAKTVRARPIVTMGIGEPTGSHHRATQGTQSLQPPTTTPFPGLGLTNPQSKLESQIAAKRCKIYNSDMHQPMGTYHPIQQYHRRPPGVPLPHKRDSQENKIRNCLYRLSRKTNILIVYMYVCFYTHE